MAVTEDIDFIENPDNLIDKYIDSYLIVGFIGEGGMGRVYKALHQHLDRIVAIKILPPHLSHDQKYKSRFKKEARAAARLNHPSIVQIYDFNDCDGMSYMVMEYVDGLNLKQLLEKEGILHTNDAINLMIQACHALAHAHEAGVIHRDIKPDNFILSDLGFLKMTDLGLAKIGLLGDPHSLGMTQTGAPLGTPYYISPEQVQSDPVDHRTDIYSLGATFFHMLTGRPPYDGKSSPLIMAKHLNETPPDPATLNPDIDPVMAVILLNMMEKSADDRPQSMMEVCHTLETHQQFLIKQAYQKELLTNQNIPEAPLVESTPETVAQTPSSEIDPVEIPGVITAQNIPEPSKKDPKEKSPDQSVIIEPPTPRDPTLFSESLFSELVREVSFALGDETKQFIQSALAAINSSEVGLKIDQYQAFARELTKNIGNITQREKVKNACGKIWKRHLDDLTGNPGRKEEYLSLLYMTQLRRLIKRIDQDSTFDIVDACLDILDLHPRKIPVNRKDELLDEVDHQLGNLHLKKQFRTEVEFITLS